MRIVINPLGEIDIAYKSGNFFTGFALAVTYFEYEANRILGMFFQGRISHETVERWSLASKIKVIFGLNLIEEEACDRIGEIIRIRNRLIHLTDREDTEHRKRDIFLRFRLNEKEKSLLLSFKECYSKLVQADFSLFEEKLGNSQKLESL